MKGLPIPHRATPRTRCILAHTAGIFVREAVGQALPRLYFQYGFLLVFLSWAVSPKGVHWQEPCNATGRCSSLHLPAYVAPMAVGLQESAQGELQEHC